MTKAEQETVIRWDREEQLVHIWTADPVVWRKLDRLGVAVKEETHAQRTGEITGRFYVPIPLALFRFGLKRQATEAQKAAGRLAGARLRKPRTILGADGENGLS